MDNQSIVLAALRYLASRCDGAVTVDGAGFNKSDSFRGKQLAARVYLTPEEVIDAFNILRRYAQSQLVPAGIELPNEQAVKLETLEAMESRGEILLAVDDKLIVSFPYYAPFISRVKQIPGARFISNGSKYWLVPLSSGNATLAAFPKFKIYDTAKAAIDSYTAPTGPVYAGKITLEGNSAVFTFDYNAVLVARVKSIPGARFDGMRKVWRVPLATFKADQWQDFQIDTMLVSHLADASAKETIANQRTAELLAKVNGPLPSGRTLFAHQKTGVEFLIKHRWAILADDMGLGKTTQALVAASLYGLPIIVICPASLQINWKREAAIVGVEIAVFSWAKIPDEPKHDYILICDEAHYAQSLKSARTKAMMQLATSVRCHSLILLTGTPIKNGRPANLYPLLQACKHPVAIDKSGYEKRYCNAHATPWTKWDITGASNLDELHEKTKDVMLRRTKKECLDLPEKTRVIRPVDASAADDERYATRLKELKARYQERLAKGEVSSEAEALVLIGQVRQAASQAKIASTVEIAEEVIDQGGSIVIFVAFHQSGETIARMLGVNLFSGDTPLARRQELVDRFQAGTDKAFVCTIGAGGVGITLTAAQTVVLVDRPFTPGETIQAEDRLHRIGQKNPVTSIWLQYGEIDEMIDDLIQTKQERINLVLEGKRKTLRGTSGKDILKALFD